MKRNVGNKDGLIRFIIGGLALAFFLFLTIQDELVRDILIGISFYTIVTGTVHYCPLYLFLDVDTRTENPLRRKRHRRKKMHKAGS
ncbi:DUF2892 domain-containing protein [Flavobacterium sp.]|uniref:YgaP family membrane protein n=1 Tax=Flavobacterium sp. TaxID=239 RepID=UPI00262A2B59|nr:DUF2892 domain-containing protein [Flavobacterium sp.]